ELALRPAANNGDHEGLYKRLLSKDRFVVVARKGNPHTAGRLTLKRYLEAPHALVAPGGVPRGRVDDLLAERGLSRRVALSVPHFLVAPHFVAESDLLLTLAERVARRYAPLLDLELHPLPLPLPGFAIHAFWHPRLQHDPAQRFLRELLFEVAREPG
ncbi:MAG TPA: LysR substrate-binding domain-containing protein, partial [Polyangiales bacterium]